MLDGGEVAPTPALAMVASSPTSAKGLGRDMLAASSSAPAPRCTSPTVSMYAKLGLFGRGRNGSEPSRVAGVGNRHAPGAGSGEKRMCADLAAGAVAARDGTSAVAARDGTNPPWPFAGAGATDVSPPRPSAGEGVCAAISSAVSGA